VYGTEIRIYFAMVGPKSPALEDSLAQKIIIIIISGLSTKVENTYRSMNHDCLETFQLTQII
jgi:hypothetical protein